MRRLSPAEAASVINPVASLSVPLGPGVPGEFMHALEMTHEEPSEMEADSAGRAAAETAGGASGAGEELAEAD